MVVYWVAYSVYETVASMDDYVGTKWVALKDDELAVVMVAVLVAVTVFFSVE